MVAKTLEPVVPLEPPSSIWEGTYSYTFGDNADAFWHFAKPETWELAGQKLTALQDRKRTALAKLCAEESVKAIKPEKDSSDAKCDLVGVDAWIQATGRRADANSRVEDPISVMLNNICRSATVESFKLVTTVVREHAVLELIGLPPGHPQWLYEKYPSRLDVFSAVFSTIPGFFVDEAWTAKTGDALKAAMMTLEAFRIIQAYKVIGYERKHEKGKSTLYIRLKVEQRLAPYHRGRVCWSLPLPGKAKDDKRGDVYQVTTPEVVILSPAVSVAMQQLSDIWQDRYAKAVLISAPPGAGKEAYANSIPHGNGRITKNMMALSLAAGSKDGLERQLFGYRRDDGSVVEGIIAKAKGSALFLDEVHQPDNEDGIRASLLRTLEADEYYPVDGTEAVGVGDVLFILATSRRFNEKKTGGSGKALSKVPPTDFWTRMSHRLELDHPLFVAKSAANGDASALQDSIVGSFFKHFWWDRVVGFFPGIQPYRSSDALKTAADELKSDHAHDLLKDADLEAAARAFADAFRKVVTETASPADASKKLKLEDVSIRGIRSMVSRLFSRAAGSIARGRKWFEASSFTGDAKSVVQDILPLAILIPKDEEDKLRAALATIAKELNVAPPME